MVGAALTTIFFIFTLILWWLWTVMYLIFASHYFLTILSDASSGQDEAQFPNETIFDWWWKPILCGLVLLIFVLPLAIFLVPIGVYSIEALAIIGTALAWLLYPLGMASALYTQNWFKVLHLGLIRRMLGHFGAFVYVYVLTFVFCAGAVWLVERTLRHDILWGLAAMVVVPAALLLYARHWGRFAWLSLNHLPGASRRPRAEKPRVQSQAGWPEGELPDVNADEEPTKDDHRPAPPSADESSENNLNPYAVLDNPEVPSFEEAPTAPAPPKPAPAPAAHLFVEEEDEWATEKKPYNLSEPDPPAAAAAAPAAEPKRPDLNQPEALTHYFDKRAKKEKAARRKAEKAMRTLPALSRKTPTFHAALFAGVWNFMFYKSTLQIWGNMVVLTMIEIFLLYMMMMFWPKPAS